MKILLIFLLICGYSRGQDKKSAAVKLALELDLSEPNPMISPEFSWFAYKLQFGHRFTNAREESNCKNVFLKNQARIHKHNSEFKKGNELYEMGVNKYSYMDFETFERTRTGAKDLGDRFSALAAIGKPTVPPITKHIVQPITITKPTTLKPTVQPITKPTTQPSTKPSTQSSTKPTTKLINLTTQSTSKTPSTTTFTHKPILGLRSKRDKFLNYTAMGYVTPVKDQGKCGSCWAFAATGQLESQYIMKYGRYLNLSEQALVDCDNRDVGCRGGNAYNAYWWIVENNIPEAQYYPYTGKQGNCTYNRTTMPGVGCRGYDWVNLALNGNETKLKLLVQNTGPITVMVQVTDNFQNYRSGIFIDNTCPPGFNHLVLAVGYGTTPEGIDYWIIKNSWGTDWGELGYMRFARNRGGMCGIAIYGAQVLI